jgi:hypothetical protein
VLLGIRAFRYRRFSVEALLGIGAFGYTRLWVVTPARSLCDFGLLQFLTDFITDFITDKLLLLVVVYLRVLIVHKCKYKI